MPQPSFPRFIVKSRANGPTARRLGSLLGANATISPSEVGTRIDHSLDLLTHYPEISYLDNPTPGYQFIRKFFTRHKQGQRRMLHEMGLPIVPTRFSDGWLGGQPAQDSSVVVRPLRHRGGRQFHVLPIQEIEGLTLYGSSYISQLIEKISEYRVLYFRGKRITTYLKTNPENIPADQPWNHDNGTRFCTIHYRCNDPLSDDFYQKLDNCTLVKEADMLAFDVLWKDRPYITEVNFAPGLTIQRTLDKIKAVNSELGARCA
jgi:hypothetical protein